MKLDDFKRKLPIALMAVVFSLSPIILINSISKIEYNYTVWAHHHQPVPSISVIWGEYFQFDWLLPVLTVATACWFLTGKGLTSVRLGWVIFCLAVMHLFCFYCWVLALYLANQKFVLF